jgi:hypothetical protein
VREIIGSLAISEKAVIQQLAVTAAAIDIGANAAEMAAEIATESAAESAAEIATETGEI